MDKFIELRQRLHMYPELSMKEYKTKKTIIDFINGFKNSNIAKINEVGETGLFVDIQGQLKQTSSKNIKLAFRADMDALPINEQSDLPYKSVVPNVMHACGHDGHIATQCAFMELIFDQISKIPSNYSFRFIFQPGEETLQGAKMLIKSGCLDQVDEIYGFHNMNNADKGTLLVKEGPILSGALEIGITITGKGGHSSDPSTCNSPITTAIEIIRLLEQMPSQDISNQYPFVMTIGKVETSSMKFNIIPDVAKIEALARIVDPNEFDNIKNKVLEICNRIGNINNSKIQVKFSSMIPVYNDERLTREIILPALRNTNYKINSSLLPNMASDDFALYAQEIPGFFLVICGYDSDHTERVNHKPLYNFNDSIISIGRECYARIVEQRLGITLFD